VARVARSGQALRLAAINAKAASLGLMPGMSLADALSRCPTLATAAHDPDADARFLAALAKRMLRFTPLVSAAPPDGLMLDITGAAQLLGGEGPLAAQAMAETGLSARHALADHAAAARALARYGGTDVRALPVAALELPAEAIEGLHRAGLRRLGDLAARPMASLAARFGEPCVQHLRAILGEGASPLTPLRAAAAIRADISFAEPIARTSDMLDAIETLLIETARQMEQHRLGGRRFIVRLERCDGAARRLEVETSLPTRDPAAVLRLLNERLETLADPLDPGFGFDAIRLAVARTEPLAPRQADLERQSAQQDSIATLIDRLATRLGPEHILRLAPVDRHIPEKAQRLIPAHQAAPAWPGSAPAGSPPLRPLMLFDPPQPVIAMASVPDGPPLRFRWQGQLHEVTLAEGPERIAPEWWRMPQGHLANHGLTRDYYRVENAQGRRFWLFRHGLYEERGDPAWYLHGLFA
jgi:protein ImuB